MAETTEEGNCLSGLLKTICRVLPRRAKRDCQYCYESKANKAFTAGKLVPLSCQSHLRDVCRNCVQSSLRTQLDNRPLLEVGCPQCKLSWESRHLRALLGHRDRKRFQKLDLIAQGRSFVPVPEQMPEKPTMDLMLDQGARLCPWCRFPFVKEGGCDHISCSNCDRGFSIEYALVLENEEGRRAANVLSDDFVVELQPPEALQPALVRA